MLCEDVIRRYRGVSPDLSLPGFAHALDKTWLQHIYVEFHCATHSPTVGLIISVTETLIIVFKHQGARSSLRFSLISFDVSHMRVGYLDFGPLPPPQLKNANATIGNITGQLTMPGEAKLDQRYGPHFGDLQRLDFYILS
jgi:hypothetical protein